MGLLSVEWAVTPEQDNKRATLGNMADVISEHVKFVRDSSGNLYYYNKGAYHPNGERVIKESYVDLLKRWGSRNSWKKSTDTALIELIRCDAKDIWDRPPLHQINFMNGIYDLYREELLEHSPDSWLSTIQIPVTYDPNAVSVYWERFLGDLFPVGPQLLLEMIGWLMVPHTRLQKAILFLGQGSNGKGTLLRMIDRIIGNSNISHVSLHQLEEERFSRGMLVGKLVNSCGDLPVGKVNNINLFKTLTGEDAIQIEYKGSHPFSYKPFCRLLFSANQIPNVNDETEGYKRRWTVIPFTTTFSVDADTGRELEENLSDPQELSGLLNLILPTILKVMERGLYSNEEIESVITNYAPIPDKVKTYFAKYILQDPQSFTPSEDLYIHFCQNLGGSPNEKEGFTRRGLVTYIKNLYPHVETSKQVMIAGKNMRGFQGIIINRNIKALTGFKVINGGGGGRDGGYRDEEF